MPSPFTKPALRTKVYVGTDMIGGGKVAFLGLVAEHGTLEAAAATMGITPKKAWFFLNTLQACFRDPIFRETPGEDASPITVTPLGHALIERFASHKTAVDTAAVPFLEWLQEVQPKQG